MAASPAPPAPKAAPSVPPRSGLSGDIAQRLEQDVLLGRIRPGERLDERDLSDRYGVSRTPVREALQRLVAGGLAVARGRQGLQVTQLSVSDLLDALTVVAELEALAAAQASRRIQPAQRAMLRAAHEACARAFAAGDHDAFYDANIEFHRGIAEGSHNAILQDELRRLSLQTAPYRRAITVQPGRMAASQPEHAAVLDAILRADGPAASALMRTHLSLLAEGIGDFLHFVQASGHAGLFTA